MPRSAPIPHRADLLTPHRVSQRPCAAHSVVSTSCLPRLYPCGKTTDWPGHWQCAPLRNEITTVNPPVLMSLASSAPGTSTDLQGGQLSEQCENTTADHHNTTDERQAKLPPAQNRSGCSTHPSSSLTPACLRLASFFWRAASASPTLRTSAVVCTPALARCWETMEPI